MRTYHLEVTALEHCGRSFKRMYHFIVCDDEQTQQLTNQILLEQWARDRGVSIRITCFPLSEDFLFHYEEDKSCDVLLLDVEMGAMDGVTLAKKIRQGNKEIQIIFITGYMDYILDGYEVEALHYLLKPITADNLHPVLDRAMKRLSDNTKILLIKHHDETVRIPLYEIRYLEVMGNYVTVYANDVYKTKATLSHFEQELDDNFLRIGRSYIVNLKCVRKVSKGELVLMDGTALLLPRGADKAVNKAIIDRL